MALTQAEALSRLASRIDVGRRRANSPDTLLPASAPAEALDDALARMGYSYATLPADWHEVALLEAALATLCRSLSARFAKDTNKAVAADAVDTTSSADEYRLLAERHETRYQRLVSDNLGSAEEIAVGPRLRGGRRLTPTPSPTLPGGMVIGFEDEAVGFGE